MEYLVTMTTRVPAGTPDAAVDDIRADEARRAAELARSGQLLRLWRPPLQPGEWRTLGLFSAPDDERLERALASMPLRVWRRDEPLRLVPHPNDPATAGVGPAGFAGSEFLITMTVTVPPGTAPAQLDDLLSREARRARELASQGHLLRLWSLPAAPGVHRALGLWCAGGDAEIAAIVDALPLRPWMAVESMPLTPHPNDPAGH
ncbi:muconolactone Delta-isomerase family protein [Roseateles sp.]|uniref:muconolactone Delta-isomerase family protein n=1 Tax=Roseateles sp. TaxID=1971397 RepID=UPI0025E62E50|nr:muconolactone Delta-isomerase family protein [Roseateles sp.]MBV8037699.1 muconolactone Delta-isomerase family protein [Roseateles sp.]